MSGLSSFEKKCRTLGECFHPFFDVQNPTTFSLAPKWMQICWEKFAFWYFFHDSTKVVCWYLSVQVLTLCLLPSPLFSPQNYFWPSLLSEGIQGHKSWWKEMAFSNLEVGRVISDPLNPAFGSLVLVTQLGLSCLPGAIPLVGDLDTYLGIGGLMGHLRKMGRNSKCNPLGEFCFLDT